VGLGGVLEERKEGGAHQEGADDVGLVDVKPLLLGGAVEELLGEFLSAALDLLLTRGYACVVLRRGTMSVYAQV
jgi:hypothetical protein